MSFVMTQINLLNRHIERFEINTDIVSASRPANNSGENLHVKVNKVYVSRGNDQL